MIVLVFFCTRLPVMVTNFRWSNLYGALNLGDDKNLQVFTANTCS